MRSKTSAGLLMCRNTDAGLEMLLAHPGGPYFLGKDEGAWTIPKGIVEPGETPLQAAAREFQEETGFTPVADHYEPLGDVMQKGGKRVFAWAFWGHCDPMAIHSNTFELEWPPGSGRKATFAEVDRVEFFAPTEARRKILPAQRAFIDRALAWSRS